MTTIELPKSWFEKRVSTDRITELLNRYRHSVVYGVWHGSRGVDLLSSTIEFNPGKLYDLGEGTQIAETGVSCQLALRVSDWGYPLAEESLRGQMALETPREEVLYAREYRLSTTLLITLRLQNDTLTDIIPERFDYAPPAPDTEIVTPPVFLRQSYS